MARRTVIVCDLDDSHEATENIALALNGSAVELDLCHEDAEKVVKTMTDLMKAGRLSNVRDLVRRPTTTELNGSANGQVDMEPGKIRAWAQEKGISLAAKGRIPQEVEEQYKADKKAAAATADKANTK